MVPESAFTDLRRHPRIRIQTPFPCSFLHSGEQYRWEGDRHGLGVVFDISGRGAKVMSETVPLLGDQVTVICQLPSQTSPMKVDVAKVRWRAAHVFGLEFTALSEFAGLRLRKFIAQTLSNRAEPMGDLPLMVANDTGKALFGFRYLDPKRLDYSIDSLRHVNEFLDQIRRDQGIEEAWPDVVVRVGAYLGEVIRRNSTKHAWCWIDYDAAHFLDPTAVEVFGKVIGTTAVLYSGAREFALPLEQVARYLRNGYREDLVRFAQTILAWG